MGGRAKYSQEMELYVGKAGAQREFGSLEQQRKVNGPGPCDWGRGLRREAREESLGQSCRATCQALGQVPSLLCLFLLSTALSGVYYLVLRDLRLQEVKEQAGCPTAEK